MRIKDPDPIEVVKYNTLLNKDKNGFLTICEKDKQKDDVYYLFAPPFSLAPCFANKIVDMIDS